ncbi:unnamed protein product [Rotaria sp. Silwood1]|nr:unnamed protein product [Rotaria sp. Silwood1]CAF0865035.1 unnamed protein product [Rotaria sp. Silwood1]
MHFYSRTTFEILPDEMILEICQYLHCSHVLYSLFDLNIRLNQTITFYCRHVWFRRASYKQLLYIYQYVLPRIGSSVLSLTLHPLHQASFPSSFKHQISNIFPNLINLTLTSWTSENLLSFIIDTLHEMKYLQKLIIQELSCSSSIRNIDFIEKIFNIKTNFLTDITFDYDCDSFDFINHSINNIISHNILSLTIQLDTLMDLSILINFIPNIHRLDVSFKNSSLRKVCFNIILPFLKEFSVWAVRWYSQLVDLKSLLQIVPLIETFSLTISTRDFNLINGTKLLSILPSQLKQFNYTVCYYPSKNYDYSNINMIKTSWKSIPVIYSISDIDKRIFLHTLPYSSSRLTIRSSLAKNMPNKDMHSIYSKIDQIQVYMMMNLSDTFPIIGQCRRVRELTLLTENESKISNSQFTSSANNNKPPVKLPYLGRLELLTIEGIPSGLQHLKELLLAAPNLCVLVIDLDCLLTLLENKDEPLILYVLLHRHILDLCVRIPDNNNNEQTKKSKLTIEKIHFIARIFTRVRNLTIDYETSEEYIELNIIKSIINEFKQLVIFHIYGKIPNDMMENDIRQWVIKQSSFRIKSLDIFRVECSNEWFKLWL